MARKINQKAVLEAIEGSGGIISTIAKRIGVTWHTAKKYTEKWKATREAMEDEKEKLADLCETKLISSIKKGNTQDAKWYLARQAKDRGYGDKLELDGNVESQIHVFEIPDNGRMTKDS